jgi:serine/threonine protein kinase
MMTPFRETLAPGTLVGSYQIVEAIGKGGFSLVYLALDLDRGDEVVLKEYLPKKLARRDSRGRVTAAGKAQVESLERGRRLFFQEAKALASLRHPNIVQVLDFFLANQTAYLVMQYERGKNLGAYIQERGGALSTTFILRVFLPILDALAMLHARSMLHLDVKPGNIHLRHGNEPVLLDLGAVHPLTGGRPRGGQVITAGFSPVEQYFKGGHVGPWTDVYAVGASIRNCMEGRIPPPAVERQGEDTLVPARIQLRHRHPPFLLEAVDWAMALEPANRPQDAGELLACLRRNVVGLPGWPLTDTMSELPGGQD